MRPSVADNVLIPQHFGSLIYVRKRHEYLPFDHLTTRILHRAVLAGLSDLPPDLRAACSSAELGAFHKLGRRMGFLDRRGRFLGVALDRDPPPDHLLGPLTLHLAVTRECDLRCRHCFAAPEMDAPQHEGLSREELEKLFDACVDLGCMRIALTGGEPMNRPDLFNLIDAVHQRGIDVCLTSNGMRLDRESARQIIRRPFAWINFSLDGASPETNDPIRGPGTFERVVANLKRYLKWKVRFGLSITLTTANVHEIPLLPKLARLVGAEVVMLRACYPIGRGQENQDLCLSLAQYRSAISALEDTGQSLVVVATSCEDEGSEELAVVFENFGCAAGNTVATVYDDGLVSPCSLIGPELAQDDLRRNSLSEIWNEGRGFQLIRSLAQPEVCANCASYSSCSGGCRARALVAYGDLGAPDPWCLAAGPGDSE